MPQLAQLSLPQALSMRVVQQAAAAPPNLRRLSWPRHERTKLATLASIRKVRHVAPWVDARMRALNKFDLSQFVF